MVEVLGRRSFVGRGVELARLRGLLADVTAGRGRTIIVAGEAGIGKSRLLSRFAELASDGGARVVEGACLETADDGVPYAPFVELLRELVRDTPSERLPALLGPARSELARLVPELATRAADLPAPSELDRAGQARLFELILGVLERLARSTPLVVVVEDVHWADRSTRELLGFLVRALRDDQVLLVLALRTDEQGAAVGNLTLVAELEREEHVERIDLGRFGRDEVEAQVASLLDGPADPAVVDRLLARCDGNPFYVEELVLAGGDLDRDLPPVLRDVLAARIAELSEPARGVLRAAAAAGRRIDDELLLAVLDLPVRALADALREAVASGILVRAERPDGPSIEFRHGLLQEAVSGELFPAERVALHAAFAEALEARAATGSRTEPAEIARHWDAARRPDRALAPTVGAAQAAELVYAFGEAYRLWARADALALAAPAAAASLGTTRDLLLERAADAAVLAGEYAAAIEMGRAAIGALGDEGDPARVGHLHDRLRWYLWEAGDRRAAAEAVAEALRLLPSDPPGVARARALGQHAGILLYAGEYEAAVREATEAIEVARVVDAPGEEALALGVLGWSLAVLGDPAAGIARFREGQAIAERLGSVEGIALAAFNLASLLDRIGQSEASLEAAADGYAMTERLGVARTYGGLLLGFRAKAEFLLGRWDEADATTRTGLRTATDRAELWLATNRARLMTGRGAFDEAAALLRRARAVEERLGGTEFASPLLSAEAELAAWQGRLTDVRAIGAQGIAIASKPGPPDPSLAWLAATVLRAEADAAAAMRGRASDADRAAVAAVVARIDSAAAAAVATTRELQSGSRRGRALLELLRAERARLMGTDAPETWADVADAWAAAGRPFPAAYARYRLGAAILAARGARSAAAAALAGAAEAARHLRAAPLLELVERLARDARLDVGGTREAAAPGSAGAGGDPTDGRSATAAAIGLTERESEVLELVAGGWTNQQIADRLFITRKTASVHVSNIMGKLGVEGRTAAAAAGHRLGLVVDPPRPPDAD
ncbi:MAG TPA: AAA family ATPase [Candidatus Limnocylindrales bacterium]|nr:AAA family ATPase [Candidatus Limnocylindrales bacterium]